MFRGVNGECLGSPCGCPLSPWGCQCLGSPLGMSRESMGMSIESIGDA